MAESAVPRALRARALGVSRSTLYYKPTQPEKDWALKCRIEALLRGHPSYGSPRIALALTRNKKPVERVMKRFGIKAYRRRGRKWKKTRNIKVVYPNLLLIEYPAYERHIWVSDFTRIPFHSGTVYLATVMDVFTRRIVGVSNTRRTAHALCIHERALYQCQTSHLPQRQWQRVQRAGVR